MGEGWTNVGRGVWTRPTDTYGDDTGMPALANYIGALLRLWSEAQSYDDDPDASSNPSAAVH